MPKENIPRFVVPEDKNHILKFIQIYVDGEPYIRWSYFSDPACQYHRNILEKSLREFGLPVNFENIRRGVAAREGERYKLSGAGLMAYNDKEEAYIMLGNSFDYEIMPNSEHLNLIAQYIPKEIKLRIGDR